MLTAWAAAVFGVLDLMVWNLPHLTIAAPGLRRAVHVVGAPGTALLTGLTTAMQQAAPDGRRGIVFAAMGVATSVGQAAGMVLPGLLGDPLGVVSILNVQGVLYLLAAAIAMRWMASEPRHRRRRSRPSRAEPERRA